MQSMDGYGKGEASNGEVSVIVEIRSTANRFKELQLRVPQPYLSLERQIKKMVSDTLQRGRIEVFIRRVALKTKQNITIDLDLSDQYYTAMKDIATHLQRDVADIPLSEIWNKQGVLVATEQEIDPLQEWIVVSTATEGALDELRRQKVENGVQLQSQLNNVLREFQSIRGNLCEQVHTINHSLQERLHKRLEQLLGGQIHPNRLAQESAILVEKSDISEELNRLESHSIELGNLTHTEHAGRQMDIILQEVHRELNTISSKVIDPASANITIQLKSRLEKLRELIGQVE